MASVTVVELTCDICGRDKDVETRQVAIDGKVAVAEVCARDWAKVEKALTPFLAAAQATKRQRRAR